MNTLSLDLVLAFGTFALISSVTPGPNNLMLLSSGMNFGFVRTIPHMLGISVGFAVMTAAVGFGLAEVFARLPVLYQIMKWLGAAYLVYLAWRIATAAPPPEPRTADAGAAAAGSPAQPAAAPSAPGHTTAARPLGFWGAAAFQWVNPKAWVMAVTAFTTYIPRAPAASLILFAALFFATVNLPSVAVWALFGSALRRALAVPLYRRIFNGLMAVLLLASLIPLAL